MSQTKPPPTARTQMTAAEAKSHFAESLRLAESGEVVQITRYGRPVAAIIGTQALHELERRRASEPHEGLQRVLGRWNDGDEFADAVDDLVAERSRPRDLPEVEL